MNDLPDKKKIIKSWVEAFRTCPTERPNATALMLAQLVEVAGSVPPEVEALFVYQVVTKRLAAFKANVSPALVAFLAASCDNPAKAVMFCVYLSYMQNFLGATTLSADNLLELFPKGIPTDESFKKLWECQKIQVTGPSSDNLLDYYSLEWLA